MGEVIEMEKVKKTRIKHDEDTSITYIKHPERGGKADDGNIRCFKAKQPYYFKKSNTRPFRLS